MRPVVRVVFVTLEFAQRITLVIAANNGSAVVIRDLVERHFVLLAVQSKPLVLMLISLVNTTPKPKSQQSTVEARSTAE